ncbi:hypothetical protein HYG81_21305 (plasmid) [Natrinema zhouii]|uniref:hypothetical protein n=1 Tax=Natrinema zhouii TaxID=1710539 RepID=UPI001CFFA9A0|nr:hypothetical protein [Natrinema zhouii]UHQ98120.1 hypothetical protein HYG81_21305 [Natrinema zhouii]
MRDFIHRVATLFASLSVVMAGGMAAFAGSAAADVTSTGDLAGDRTDTVTSFNASADEDRTITYETTATTDSNDNFEELSIELTYDGNTYAEYGIDDAEIESAGTTDDVLEVVRIKGVGHTRQSRLERRNSIGERGKREYRGSLMSLFGRPPQPTVWDISVAWDSGPGRYQRVRNYIYSENGCELASSNSGTTSVVA